MDLVPRGRLWQNVVALCGAAVVAGLLAGHWATHRADAALPTALVHSLDVRAGDSLAGWFRAGVLAAAAATALLVYAVRRHRTDDYRAGYRVWLWAAACMLAMSADAVAGLRGACQAACVAEFGWSGPADGVLWWAAPCILAAGTIGLRLVFDMRECRTSTGWFAVAAVAWTLGDVLAGVGPAFGDALTSDLAAAGCSIYGQWCLLVSMNWHARHVVLEASGALRSRNAKKSRRKAAEKDVESAASADADAATPERASRRETESASKSATANSNSTNAGPQASLAAKLTFGGRAANESSTDTSHLSKAQRKKLKREMRRAA